jgi:hypothetical protein
MIGSDCAYSMRCRIYIAQVIFFLSSELFLLIKHSMDALLENRPNIQAVFELYSRSCFEPGPMLTLVPVQKAMWVIRLKRIYNFWCFMLVFTSFALCFVTLRGVFMWFPKLTYWQDATVPLPCFLLFLCLRKATQEIFSELDETKARSLIFPGSFPKTERQPERGQSLPSHQGGAAQALAVPPRCEEALAAPWRCPFAYKKPRDGKP